MSERKALARLRVPCRPTLCKYFELLLTRTVYEECTADLELKRTVNITVVSLGIGASGLVNVRIEGDCEHCVSAIGFGKNH
jgi:hypothetical protein